MPTQSTDGVARRTMVQFHLSVNATPAFASTRCVSKVFLDMRHEGGRSSQKKGKVNPLRARYWEEHLLVLLRAVMGGRQISLCGVCHLAMWAEFFEASFGPTLSRNAAQHTSSASFPGRFHRSYSVLQSCTSGNPYTKSIISNFKLVHVINTMFDINQSPTRSWLQSRCSLHSHSSRS